MNCENIRTLWSLVEREEGERRRRRGLKYSGGD
jgi:hypothetical protein